MLILSILKSTLSVMFLFLHKILINKTFFQLGDLKVTRSLASEITIKGASLYDLLLKETKLRVSNLYFYNLSP